MTVISTSVASSAYVNAGGSLTVTNTGTVVGGSYGVYGGAGSSVTNAGSIGGTNDGVELLGNTSLVNTGVITGGQTGVLLLHNGLVTVSGAISGAAYAIYAKGNLTLDVLAGASFSGKVADHLGTGTLDLAGTLNMGGSFSGFDHLSFTTGTISMLSGDAAELAAQETISGFTFGDALALTGFAATAASYARGTGLVLSNATGSQTIELSGSLTSDDFTLRSDGTNTTITGLVSTITGTLTNNVVAGNGTYAAALSVAHGGIVSGGTYGILGNGGSISISNAGSVGGGGFGVTLADGANFSNQGHVSGQYGLYANNSTVTNSGVITGTSIGAAVENGASLSNSGQISGQTGVFVATGSLTDSGTIAGTVDAILAQGAFVLNVQSGAVFSGAVVDKTGTGVLNLAGATAGTLDLGGSVSGFSSIAFGGAVWTLAGTAAELANGQSISGDAPGDTLILQDFAATAASYIAGTGLVLSNASASETLHVTTAIAGEGLVLSSNGTASTLTGEIATISSLLTHGVQPGNGTYATSLTVTGSGTISGSAYAVLANGPLSLAVESGAAFSGAVEDTAATGVLRLAGTTAGSLDMGSSFSGFSSIAFGSAIWTLAGDTAALTAGQSISGFTWGDQIELSNFAATSETFIAGTGLVLSNATASQTLALSTSLTGDDFALTSNGGASTITGAVATISSTIINTAASNTVPGSVAVYAGHGTYAAVLSISTTGAVDGGAYGIDLMGGAGSTITNSGSIEGGAYGLRLINGASGTNTSAGQVTGSQDFGVYLASATFTNDGTISGGANGVYLEQSSLFLNTNRVDGGVYGGAQGLSTLINSGIISDTGYGVFLNATSGQTDANLIINTGTIASSDHGGLLLSHGTLINSGIISGTTVGVRIFTDATVTTSGTMAGTSYALTGSDMFVLNVEAGAVFEGAVRDRSGVLNLAGTTAGTLDMGASFSGFSTIGFGSAAWTLEGNEAELTAGQTITGFAMGDTIVLRGFTATAESMTSAGLALSNGTTTATLALTGALDVTTSNGNTDITLCFYPGTRIATASGEVAVEALRAGDRLLTSYGLKPVRWIGQSPTSTRFADPLRVLPVRITQGALGGGLPWRDLLVSPDHAVFLSGLLIQAAALVNGVTIRREHRVPECFTYYHVELASHELLLAEGLPVESFVDHAGRMAFANWASRPGDAQIAELPYPRIKSARQLPQALRAVLQAHSRARDVA